MHLLHSHKTIKVASCLFFRALSPIRLLFELLSLPEFMEHSPQLLSRKYRVAQYTVNPLENKSSRLCKKIPTFRDFPKNGNFFIMFSTERNHKKEGGGGWGQKTPYYDILNDFFEKSSRLCNQIPVCKKFRYFQSIANTICSQVICQ